jgi:hypothetical protein
MQLCSKQKPGPKAADCGIDAKDVLAGHLKNANTLLPTNY